MGRRINETPKRHILARKESSHTRTVVRECCKGDDQSQWRRANFNPPLPLNPLTDLHKNLYRWLCRGYLPPAKFCLERIRGFASAHAQLRAPMFTRLFFWGSRNHLQPRRHHGHQRKIRQKARFCARMCLLAVKKTKFYIYPPSPPPKKNRHFGARFRRYLKIFGRKTALTLEVLRVNDP